MNYEEIKNSATKVENYNTNNAWGFGGAVGKEYTLENGFSIVHAKACYRHIKPTSFIQLRLNGVRLNDDSPASGKKIIEKLYPIVKDMRLSEYDVRVLSGHTAYIKECDIDKVNTVLKAFNKKPLTVAE